MVRFALCLGFNVSLRQFRIQPGFTATIVLTLALGIGATTSTLSVVKAVTLNPLTKSARS